MSDSTFVRLKKLHITGSSGPSVVAPRLLYERVPSPTAIAEPQLSLGIPTVSIWHVALHPSPGVVFPSSHRSPEWALTMRSPHRESVQFALHSAVSPPPTHRSPASMTPLPHVGGGGGGGGGGGTSHTSPIPSPSASA